jgi:antitoxin PrlF
LKAVIYDWLVVMAVTLDPCPESTLTDRYQTTVPDAVRKVLGLNKRDKIRYTIQPDGQVLITRAEPAEGDPILAKFLDFLAQDIDQQPQQVQAIDGRLMSRISALVVGVELDLDASLADEDE